MKPHRSLPHGWRGPCVPRECAHGQTAQRPQDGHRASAPDLALLPTASRTWSGCCPSRAPGLRHTVACHPLDDLLLLTGHSLQADGLSAATVGSPLRHLGAPPGTPFQAWGFENSRISQGRVRTRRRQGWGPRETPSGRPGLGRQSVSVCIMSAVGSPKGREQRGDMVGLYLE